MEDRSVDIHNLKQKFVSFELLGEKGLTLFKSELLSDDFGFLSEIITLLPQEDDFVQQIGEFYLCHGKEDELLHWAIQREIAATDASPELFRMQSFATQLLFKIFFGERGISYLLNTVSHVINTIMHMKEDKLELVPNGISVSVDEAFDNLRFVLDLIRQLFSLLDAKMGLIPRVIRRGFVYMKQISTKKFPEVEHSVVPICFFLRCLCPTLMQPEQFGITKEKPEGYTQKALIIISKLLQNIANGIIKNNITTYAPHNKYVLTFIKESIVTVKKICDKLTDLENINRRQSSICVVETTRFESTIKLFNALVNGKFREYLDRITAANSELEKFQKDLRESSEAFIKKFNEDILYSDWKKYKETDKFTGYMCKSIQTLYKVEGTLPVSLESIRQCIGAMSFHDWFEVFRDKCIIIEKSKFLCNVKGGEKWLIKLKFPFPYTPRNATVDKFSMDISQDEFIVMLKSQPQSTTPLDACFSFKTNTDTCSQFLLYYRMVVDTNFPHGTLVAIGKDLFRAVKRLSCVLTGLTSLSRKSSVVKSPKTTPNSTPGTVSKKSMSFRKLIRRSSDSFQEDNSHESSSSTSTTSTASPSASSHTTDSTSGVHSSRNSTKKSQSAGSIRKKFRGNPTPPTSTENLGQVQTPSTETTTTTPVLRSISDDSVDSFLRKTGMRTQSSGTLPIQKSEKMCISPEVLRRRISVSKMGSSMSANTSNSSVSLVTPEGKEILKMVNSLPPLIIHTKGSSTPKLTPMKIRKRSQKRQESPVSSPKVESKKESKQRTSNERPTLEQLTNVPHSILENSEEVSLISDEDLGVGKLIPKTPKSPIPEEIIPENKSSRSPHNNNNNNNNVNILSASESDGEASPDLLSVSE